MIAGTGAEHHRFAPVLAFLDLLKPPRSEEGGWAAAQRPSCFANLPYIKKISPDKMPRLIRRVERIKL